MRVVSSISSSQLHPCLPPPLSFLPLSGYLLLAVISIYLQNEGEDDNVIGVLKVNSIVLQAFSDTQVKTWVYRKSKYNYYENVHYCLE